ncbi:MAG: hypothetical protein ACTHU0_10015 [Kofleriaceae bacterium]
MSRARTSEAYKRRVDALARRLVIAALGWTPEPENCPGERYAATCDEMLSWLRESQPALAARIENARSIVLRPYYAKAMSGHDSHECGGGR